MWCKNCNIETNEYLCPICGTKTVEDIPTEVYWCDECKVPVIQETNRADRGICPMCGKHMKYMSADLRPVFPEERLLLEMLLGKEPHEYKSKSVWASNNRYYINGHAVSLPSKLFQETNVDDIVAKMEKHKADNTYDFFDQNIEKFVLANQQRLHYLKDEAYAFIHEAAKKFDEEHIVLSFSGGKDSTVTADIVIKALSNPSLVHIFGDTTLEFPSTIEYMTSNSNGINLPRVSEKTIGKLKIPLPPLEEQNEIVKIVESVLKSEEEIQSLLEMEREIEMVEKAILDRAFRGELGTNCAKERVEF